MNPPTMALASTLSPTRNGELTAAYVDTLPGDIKVHVITDQDEIDVRAAALHAKLVPLGITDLTQEGTLVLSGETEITPGLRRGVVLTGHVDTTDRIDLDTLPEYFGYTNFGRTATKSVMATTMDTLDFERSPRTSRARASRPVGSGTLESGAITAGTNVPTPRRGTDVGDGPVVGARRRRGDHRRRRVAAAGRYRAAHRQQRQVPDDPRPPHHDR